MSGAVAKETTGIIPVITVDGAAATGKGALAAGLAAKLGFNKLDSGLYYRALAYLALRFDVAFDNDDLVGSVLPGVAGVMRIKYQDKKIWVTFPEINGNGTQTLQLPKEIRNEEHGAVASRIARWKLIREKLYEAQREARQPPGLVAEGRDMGSVIFPDARVKIYLTCEVQERARRRKLQLENQGLCVNIADVLQDLKERDYRDLNRNISPLVAPVDAYVIDSTTITLEEVIGRCLKICEQNL